LHILRIRGNPYVRDFLQSVAHPDDDNNPGLHMKTFLGHTITVIATALVVGCASTGENLQRSTATNIGNNIDPADITITNVERSMSSVKWHAAAGGISYNCSADDMVRQIYCLKK
jgi:hypothetical protein